MSITDIRLTLEELLPDFEPGGRLLGAWELKGGISSQMTAFEVERPDGQLVRRVARKPGSWKFEEDPNASETEFRTIQTVRRAGVPAPEAIYLQPLTATCPQPIYILEFVEGDPNFSPASVANYAERFAEVLARIHGVDLDTFDLSFLPRVNYQIRPQKAEPNEALQETAIRAALASWTANPLRNPPCLRHGDLWPGNVLWRDEEVVGVIDWEETQIGEPVADLGICRLDLLWVFGEEAMHLFTKRYQEIRNLDLSSLPYWDLIAGLRPITNLAEWCGAYPSLGRPDVTLATMTAGHRWFIQEALAEAGSHI